MVLDTEGAIRTRQSKLIQFRKRMRDIALIVVLLGYSGRALAADFDTQIQQLNANISASQGQINLLQNQQQSLQDAINILNAQIAAINNQIVTNNARVAKVTADIEAARIKLADKKTVLAENIRTMYQQSTVSSLEMLASSDDFGEYFDRQVYLDQVKDKIQEAMADVQKVKTDLEKQQADLTALLTELKNQQALVASQKAQQQQLLAQTQGQESKYQQMVGAQKQQLQQVIAARAEALRRSNVRVGGSGCGGYPAVWCNARQDSLVDDWNYYNRECVSYVAWWRSMSGLSVPDSWGNAGDWYSRARASSNPQHGDIVVWPYTALTPYGHVAVVESNNGGSVTVSEYNFDYGQGPGRYGTRTIPFGDYMLSGARYIH